MNTLIYCYDAYCGWCYGFSPVIKKIAEKFKEELHVEVLSGGMVLPDEPTHIRATASYIVTAYKRVEELTGIEFGPDYLWHINNPEESDWYPHSLKPATALSIIKELKPDSVLAFAGDLQYALHYEGRDLTDDEAYRHLLEKYKLDAEDFYTKLKEDKYKAAAEYDFALCKQLKVTGYPTLFIQSSDSKFYLVAQGYTGYDVLEERVRNVLEEIKKQA